jgi:hypothetical protein
MCNCNEIKCDSTVINSVFGWKHGQEKTICMFRRAYGNHDFKTVQAICALFVMRGHRVSNYQWDCFVEKCLDISAAEGRMLVMIGRSFTESEVKLRGIDYLYRRAIKPGTSTTIEWLTNHYGRKVVRNPCFDRRFAQPVPVKISRAIKYSWRAFC